MNKSEALSEIRALSEENFNSLFTSHSEIKDEVRRNLLYKFIQGEIQIGYNCAPDLEMFAIKTILPDTYKNLEKNSHPYSSGDLYEYDPAKNGKNIIKHGLSFSEVVSYSTLFGALSVPFPDDQDVERFVMFSDLNSGNDGKNLTMPFGNTRGILYVLSIVTFRGDKWRFISSRIMSTDNYKKDMLQAFKDVWGDKKIKESFVDECIDTLKRNLFQNQDN